MYQKVREIIPPSAEQYNTKLLEPLVRKTCTDKETNDQQLLQLNSVPSTIYSLAVKKKLNYYAHLDENPFQNVNTTFEVRYFEIDHEWPSKEVSSKEIMKLKTNGDACELNAHAIEVRVFEFKRKNVSDEKGLMQKIKSKLDSQHSEESESISNSLFPEAVSMMSNQTIKLPPQEHHCQKCNLPRNKPKSAPPVKVSNPITRFRDIFGDNTARKLDMNSSRITDECMLPNRDVKKCAEPLGRKHGSRITGSVCDDAITHTYNQFRCRGGDCNFARRGHIFTGNQMQSFTNTGEQCSCVQRDNHVRKSHKLSMCCSNYINIPTNKQTGLYNLNYPSYQNGSRKIASTTVGSQTPSHFISHKENRRHSSPLCNPLILSNKFDNFYERFYDMKYTNSDSEQDSDCECLYKIKQTSSLCGNKVHMDNVNSTTTYNLIHSDTSNGQCSAFNEENFKIPKNENYVRQCFVEPNYNCQDEGFTTNVIYGSQTTLDNRIEIVSEYSKSSLGPYEFTTDGVTPTSNPKIFNVDNYQDRNVYHIQHSECYTNANFTSATNKMEQKFKKKIK